MKEKLLLILSYILVAAAATVLTLDFVTPEPEYSKLAEVEALIGSYFIGEADLEQMEDYAADALVYATGDPWSYYIPAGEFADYVEQSANAYVGVGITIEVREGEGFLITQITPDGPAQEAGLQVNDLLIGVGEQDVREMETTQVRELVRGEPGTSVFLRVLRKGEAQVFEVERRQVLTEVASWELVREDIGLITIANFQDRCAEETIAAIESAMEAGAEKLIFDVRFNPGGYATEMVTLLDYLLPEGELYRSVWYNGDEEVEMSDEKHLDVPMAVLMNEGTYSAAEFFAAALREYDAAVLVGEHTVGKGYFQLTYPLQDGSALVLSSGEYFTPKGVSLAGEGLAPDEEVILDEDQLSQLYYGTLEREQDPQLLAAIRALGGVVNRG